MTIWLLRGEPIQRQLTFPLIEIGRLSVLRDIGEVEESEEGDRTSDDSVDEEDPLPAFETGSAVHRSVDSRHHGTGEHVANLTCHSE